MKFKLLCAAAVLVIGGEACISPAVGDDREDAILAVRNDNPGELKDRLARGLDPNFVDASGEPALVNALRFQAYRAADLLIANPATDLNRANQVGETPLMLAAYFGREMLVEKLIARGAQVNKPGWTPLHYAAGEGHRDVVLTLLSRSAAIDSESPNKMTPLMMAARGRQTDMCRLLVAKGADPARTNDAGFAAADFARRASDPALADWLEQQARAFKARSRTTQE
jgi:hypothetical protein